MSLLGSCHCNNIALVWHTRDYSLVPRACQCQHCRAKALNWVSKSGTRVEITIFKKRLHQVYRQGSESAAFHACRHCNDVVFVTADIEGELYCALNASCISNPIGFGAPAKMEKYDQPAAQKRQRWRDNWCCPVSVSER